jgi:hypothetical protein
MGFKRRLAKRKTVCQIWPACLDAIANERAGCRMPRPVKRD